MQNMIDRSVFLGDPEDPQPVWRDEAEDAASWPEGAVFKITFTRERFPHAQSELPRTDFFGSDGWPWAFPRTSNTHCQSRSSRVFRRSRASGGSGTCMNGRSRENSPRTSFGVIARILRVNAGCGTARFRIIAASFTAGKSEADRSFRSSYVLSRSASPSMRSGRLSRS